jgi:RecA-family ATPase
MTAQAFQQFASSVASAPEDHWLQALRSGAHALIRQARAGQLPPQQVEDEIARVANQFDVAGKVDAEKANVIWELLRQAKGEVEIPDHVPEVERHDEPANSEMEVDESPPETARAEIPWQAFQALASWNRLLENLEDRSALALQFTRGATEVLRLASPEASPQQWQQLVDDLHAIGERQGLAPAVVQTLMAAATQEPRDRRPGEEPKTAAAEEGASARHHHDDGPTSEADYGAQDFERLPVATLAPLALVTPPAWRDLPVEPMRWLATHRIPAGDATILSGDGGGGKTTVALQLAVSVERGLGDWLGTTCEAGPVIFVSAEEPDHEMRRRLQRVARKRGIEPDEIACLHFHFASPENCLLAVSRPDGTMGPTPLFEALAIAAAAIRPVLIIVDSIAATFGGNQNDRVHARTFVALFRRLAQDVDCAVLLLDHPSLSGITNGTGRGGSMDWQNATRARLHLETVQGADGITSRVLEMKKSNYGPIGDKVTLQWEDGCFVMEGSEAGQAAPYRAAAQQGLDDLFVRLLEERNAQCRWVTPSKAAGYAPKELAAMPAAGGVTAVALAHAMERLLTGKRIIVETFGPPSKQRQRLVTAALPTTLPTAN